MHVSHTTDNFTSRTLLYSGIEVKPENGDQKEAELQMGIWMAASLRKKMELAKSAFSGTAASERESLSNPEPHNELSGTQASDFIVHGSSFTALLEPSLAIIGHEHKLYYAYPSSAAGDVTILGPDEKFMNLSTRSVQGIFRLISFYATILDYGYGENTASGEGSEGGLWVDFLKKVTKEIG